MLHGRTVAKQLDALTLLELVLRISPENGRMSELGCSAPGHTLAVSPGHGCHQAIGCNGNMVCFCALRTKHATHAGQSSKNIGSLGSCCWEAP